MYMNSHASWFLRLFYPYLLHEYTCTHVNQGLEPRKHFVYLQSRMITCLFAHAFLYRDVTQADTRLVRKSWLTFCVTAHAPTSSPTRFPLLLLPSRARYPHLTHSFPFLTDVAHFLNCSVNLLIEDQVFVVFWSLVACFWKGMNF